MYDNSRLNDSKSQKETFQLGNSLLFSKTNKIISNYVSVEAQAERFAHYFSDKIKNIRDGFLGATVYTPLWGHFPIKVHGHLCVTSSRHRRLSYVN